MCFSGSRIAIRSFFKTRRILLPALLLILASAPILPAQGSPGRILGGSRNSPVRIDVFSDFQCAACRELFLNTIKPILKEYSARDKVCVVYHEYPVAGHKLGLAAARYVEAAHRLGLPRLLAVMESIFLDQAAWARTGNLEASVAKAMPPADFSRLKQIMQDPRIGAEVNRHIQYALQQKIQATPTLIIRAAGKEERVDGYIPYPVMKHFIGRYVK